MMLAFLTCFESEMISTTNWMVDSRSFGLAHLKSEMYVGGVLEVAITPNSSTVLVNERRLQSSAAVRYHDTRR